MLQDGKKGLRGNGFLNATLTADTNGTETQKELEEEITM